MENILTVEQIFSPGNTIQIIFSKYIGKVESFKATVKALNEEGLYISIPEFQFANFLVSGAEITIQYEAPDGREYLFGTYKIARISKEDSALFFAKPWKINSSLLHRYFDSVVETPWKVHSISLRRYFRLKVDLHFYYSFDEIIYIGQVVDLSIGGLFAIVQPDPRFLLGNTLTFQLQFPNTLLFELEGEIVRSQTIENTKLGIGISFTKVSEDTRYQISKYL